MRPVEAHALLRRGEAPKVRLMRLCSELAAIRELYAVKIINRRGNVAPTMAPEKIAAREQITASVAQHFVVWVDVLRQKAIEPNVLTARRVLMALLHADVRMTQDQIAGFLNTDQETVSKSIAIAKKHHGETIALLRGNIATVERN
jgi:chromosomal replication initiation ATPase DnaA